MRKYTERANSWFGISIFPKDASLKFGLHFEFEWKHSPEMDAMTRGLSSPRKITDLLRATKKKREKIGSNDPCPCGSGKKYKKCCRK